MILTFVIHNIYSIGTLLVVTMRERYCFDSIRAKWDEFDSIVLFCILLQAATTRTNTIHQTSDGNWHDLFHVFCWIELIFLLFFYSNLISDSESQLTPSNQRLFLFLYENANKNVFYKQSLCINLHIYWIVKN